MRSKIIGCFAFLIATAMTLSLMVVLNNFKALPDPNGSNVDIIGFIGIILFFWVIYVTVICMLQVILAPHTPTEPREIPASAKMKSFSVNIQSSWPLTFTTAPDQERKLHIPPFTTYDLMLASNPNTHEQARHTIDEVEILTATVIPEGNEGTYGSSRHLPLRNGPLPVA